MSLNNSPLYKKEDGILGRMIAFCIRDKLVVLLLFIGIAGWGISVAPFDWGLKGVPRSPVPVDAIPNIGPNQQIVFTEWRGRSPQDIEDQITYPLTSELLGVPGVQSVRSMSMFGFSSIYIIFDEDTEFYWSRSRILEKLNSLSENTLPGGVRPRLGPDATALGQIFWYTLEGRGPEGNPTGGWSLNELRTHQDWLVRYELLSVPGVAEVASVGGFVQEYQVHVDPAALREYGVSMTLVINALRKSNIDTGARTLEINKAEYVIRGLGFVKNKTDLEEAVVRVQKNVPLRVRDVAAVNLGPALRRGALDKGGAEAVGGVVVVRFGENPMAVIQRVKERIENFRTSMPEKTVTVTGPDGTRREVSSKLTIVPFYDRTELIQETLGTLRSALTEEILVTIIVVVILLSHLRSSLLISGLLPLAVLMCFIAMRIMGITANVVALSGIAIAIGTMVDMGIVLNENIFSLLNDPQNTDPRSRVIYEASVEVGSAVMTAVATTVISFLPVFTMQAEEGKLFKPLAYTKTFALVASLIVALFLIPTLAHLLLGRKEKEGAAGRRMVIPMLFAVIGVLTAVVGGYRIAGIIITGIALYPILSYVLPKPWNHRLSSAANWIVAASVLAVLAVHWRPMGVEKGMIRNLIFVAAVIGLILGAVWFFKSKYTAVLAWALANKVKFIIIPIAFCVFGLVIWLGFGRVFGFIPGAASAVGVSARTIQTWGPWSALSHKFPGLSKEFMPDLEEGSFLLMPTTMPHASIGEAMDVLRKQDMALSALHEVRTAVGKIGRVESPLDPAPVSMIETVINYHPEFLEDDANERMTFRFMPEEIDLFRTRNGDPVSAPDGEPYTVQGAFARDEYGQLIPDPDGMPFRMWRPELDPDLNPGRKPWKGIQDPDDIWEEILRVTAIPGTTSAPKLQPIAARLVMLQSGMRAPMGVKVFGKGKTTLNDLENAAIRIETLLKEVPSVRTETVNAERVVGKPYLELDIDRRAISRYGLNVKDVQDVIQAAVGGMVATTTIEGRERYNVLVRYKRELRNTPERLNDVMVSAPSGQQVPLAQLIRGNDIQYRRGPQVIKGEDNSLVTYVTFDKRKGFSEVDVVETARAYLRQKQTDGELDLPAGISYDFAGSYKSQVRSEKRLAVVLPLALFLIFMIIYLQFKSVLTTLIIFAGIFVAWAGGFIMIWLYGESWFMNVNIFGVNIRDLFAMHPVNLSVAIWVGFLALFGIATDDGVIMATYLTQRFDADSPQTIPQIRAAVIQGAQRRIRPALMTSATTIIALLPVLSSTGKGAEIMVPMAIPSFGGMILVSISAFVVPVLYCAIKERQISGKK